MATWLYSSDNMQEETLEHKGTQPVHELAPNIRVHPRLRGGPRSAASNEFYNTMHVTIAANILMTRPRRNDDYSQAFDIARNCLFCCKCF